MQFKVADEAPYTVTFRDESWRSSRSRWSSRYKLRSVKNVLYNVDLQKKKKTRSASASIFWQSFTMNYRSWRVRDHRQRFTVYTAGRSGGYSLPSSRECECPSQVDIHLGLTPPRLEDDVEESLKRPSRTGKASVVAVPKQKRASTGEAGAVAVTRWLGDRLLLLPTCESRVDVVTSRSWTRLVGTNSPCLHCNLPTLTNFGSTMFYDYPHGYGRVFLNFCRIKFIPPRC